MKSPKNARDHLQSVSEVSLSSDEDYYSLDDADEDLHSDDILDDGHRHSACEGGGKVKKSRRKKMKKQLKKAMKKAAYPVKGVAGLVGGSSKSLERRKSSVLKKEKKKKKKNQKSQVEDDDSISLGHEGDTNFVSLVKYEKLRSQLDDKKALVDTLQSKIRLLEESQREKDEIIIRLQNVDLLKKEIEEKNGIIKLLSQNESVPLDTSSNDFKFNTKLLKEIRRKKRELENFRTSYRRLSSDSIMEMDVQEANNENIFYSWKRQNNRMKDAQKQEKSADTELVSKSSTAQEAKHRRLESSDVLHKLRKEKTTTTAPKKNAAEPWKAVHTFLLPAFNKTLAERTLIQEALKSNYIFENLKSSQLDAFIGAFQNVEASKGKAIIKKGDDVGYFYIVADGKVSIEIDGKYISKGPGSCFGELEILYSSARKATVIPESAPTHLFRVDEKTFRFTMRRTVKEANRKKLALLKEIKILQDFEATDLQRLCDNMVDRKFVKEEVVLSKRQKSGAFYVVMSGAMKVTDIQVGNSMVDDVVLKSGDYFGEHALVMDAPPSANLVGMHDGWCFGIDKETFDKVLGNFSRAITKSKDKLKLMQVKLIKDAEFDSSLLDSLADAVAERKFEAGEVIQNAKVSSDAALYLIHEGSIIISTNDYQQVLTAGNYFGEDQLLGDAKGLTDSNARMIANYTVVSDTESICGILTLKECRLLFDTSNVFRSKEEDVVFDHLGVLKRRSDRSTPQESTKSLEEDFSQAFYNERRAIREFYKSLNTPIESLNRESLLGEGQFGAVWLVRIADEEHSEDFALKIQDMTEALKTECLENVHREMHIISVLQHPFIVDLIDSKESGGESFMLMTLCKGGELWNVIHDVHADGTWESGVPEADAKFYSFIIADVVAYIHRKNVLFRDLKPENVLIDSDGYPNIIDFGFAKITTEKSYTLCGTPNYMAPEIVLVGGHGVGVDHWALGIMIYEMLSGEHPFYYEGLDNSALFELVTKTEPYPCIGASYEAKKLMAALLEKDPTQRIGVLAGRERDILSHEWFSDLDLNKLRAKEIKAPWIPPSG